MDPLSTSLPVEPSATPRAGRAGLDHVTVERSPSRGLRGCGWQLDSRRLSVYFALISRDHPRALFLIAPHRTAS